MADDPALLQYGDHFELVFVGADGATTYGFGYQPRTEDIADRATARYHYCIQLIGETYEVYDLATIKKHLGTPSIGLPVFTSQDPDVAIMWALMNL